MTTVCGDVFVFGQSGESVTEDGTGDTLFLNGQNGHRPDIDKQVSLCLHSTTTGGIHDPIPEGCSCACVSSACVRPDRSGDSNSVQMGSIDTECSAVTKQVVAKNGSGQATKDTKVKVKETRLLFQMLVMFMMNM